MATATGDLLFSRAFAELAAGGARDAVRVLSDASSALAAGRAAAARGRVERSRSPASATCARCDLKTARLFEAACRLGALGGRRATRSRSARFGRDIGLAFQLLDDVLDVSGPAERTGKHRGTDLLDGTVTLPLILARERDPALAALDLRAVRTPAQAEAVCDAIAATGALEVARAEALEMVRGAKAALPALPEAPAGRAGAGGRRRRRPLRAERLEVFGEDRVGAEGGDEALDLVLHVRLGQPLEVAHERLGAAVELVVEAVDGRPGRRCRARSTRSWGSAGGPPSASGRALRPLHRVDELALAVGADVQRRRCRARRERLGRGRLGEVLEVDDLDRAAGGKDDAADVLAVVGRGGSSSLEEWLAAHLIGVPSEILDSYIRASDSRYASYRSSTANDQRGFAVLNIGPTELIIVLVIVLLIFGPKRLPGLGRSSAAGCASSRTRSAARAGATTTRTTTRAERDAQPAQDRGRARPSRGRAGAARGRGRLRAAPLAARRAAHAWPAPR